MDSGSTHPTYWIFVATEYSSYNIGSIQDIIRRVNSDGKWYIGPRTQNRNRLKRGDRVILYQTGEQGKKFIGSATISSELTCEKDPFGYVVLSDMSIWEKPVKISSVLESLSVVKNKKRWSVYFQGGIVNLPERDYLHIIETAQEHRRAKEDKGEEGNNRMSSEG